MHAYKNTHRYKEQIAKATPYREQHPRPSAPYFLSHHKSSCQSSHVASTTKQLSLPARFKALCPLPSSGSEMESSRDLIFSLGEKCISVPDIFLRICVCFSLILFTHVKYCMFQGCLHACSLSPILHNCFLLDMISHLSQINHDLPCLSC